MDNRASKSLDWALWFYWIMATTLGWLAGNALFQGIPIVIAGVAIAALQWSVLYKRIPKAWRWLILSSLGWIGGYILLLLLVPSAAGALIGPILGAAVGLMQWLILREVFAWSGWWIVISILAWTTGLTVLPGALTSGALPGALTGLTLVIFFRFSLKQVQ